LGSVGIQRKIGGEVPGGGTDLVPSPLGGKKGDGEKKRVRKRGGGRFWAGGKGDPFDQCKKAQGGIY